MRDALGAESAGEEPVLRGARAVLWASPTLLADLDLSAWADDGELLLAAQAGAAAGVGRGAARVLRLGGTAAAPERAWEGVWRTNRHGGWLGRLRGDAYASPARLAREVALVARLRRLELPTPPVLLALAARRGRRWRQHLVTARVPAAVTVFEAGADARAAAAAAALLEEAFDVGLWSPDLHPGNLLWQPESGHCWLIDLAGARMLERPLRAGERRARVARFLRFFVKHAGAVPAPYATWGA